MLVDRIESIEILPHEPPFSPKLLAELGVEGISVGCSWWNLRADCLNTDFSKLETRGGQSTEYGRLALIDEKFCYLEYDATKDFPLPDAFFPWMHTEHLIEHLPQPGTIALLKEARRMLAPGGLLRVTTPDLALYIDGYRDPSKKFFNQHWKVLDALGRMLPEGADDEVPEIHRRPAWMVNQIFQCWGHKWIYDFDELVYVLREAGFDESTIERCSFRRGKNPNVAALDIALRRDETIYVEAIRT
jgi:predicted SAM-dependent methyltransferase